MSLEPQPVTVETLRDYFEWHVQNGRGRFKAMIDRRGLMYLVPEKYEKLGAGIPHHDDTHDDKAGKVFIRVVIP